MSKSAAERSREWRKEQAAKRASVTTARDEVVELLRLQIADLKDQRDAAEARCERIRITSEQHTYAIRMLSERVANIAEQLAGSPARDGGSGGSLSLFSSLSPIPYSEREAQSFQDLKAETRAPGKLANGTRVPGTLGDESVRNDTDTKPNGIRMPNERAASVSDFERAETELKRKPLRDPEMVAKARSEAKRLEALAVEK